MGHIPPTGMAAGASQWRLMCFLLPPGSSRGATSSTLHTPLLKHAHAQPCMPHQCPLHLLLQLCGRATSSLFWQVLCSSSTCGIDRVSPTYVASDAAFRAAATPPVHPVHAPAPASLPVLLQGSLQQLKTPNPAARHSSRAAVCTSGLAGRQQSEIQLKRS